MPLRIINIMSRQKTAQTQEVIWNIPAISLWSGHSVITVLCLCALAHCREKAGTTLLSRGWPLYPYWVNVRWECSLRTHGNLKRWESSQNHFAQLLLSCWPCPGASSGRSCDFINPSSWCCLACELHPALLLWRAKPASDQPQLGHSRGRAEGQVLGVTALQFRVRARGKEFPQRFLHSTQRNKTSTYKSKVIWIKSDINQKWYELRQRE